MIPNQRGDHHIHSNKRWTNLMPFFVALVVIAEIAFLSRLDKSSMVNSWADSFYQFTSLPWSSSFHPPVDNSDLVVGSGQFRVLDSETDSCEEWLEREDSVVYSRDFKSEPIFVFGSIEHFKPCAVGCKFGFDSGKVPDAAIGLGHSNGGLSVLRSMESAQYYAENNIAYARRKGYDIVMTTSLSSDVPVGYFSWAEYDIMAPVQPKTEKALAAAFISNCAARNFRLQALQGLEKENIKIDSYGGCHRNRDGRGFTFSPKNVMFDHFRFLSVSV